MYNDAAITAYGIFHTDLMGCKFRILNKPRKLNTAPGSTLNGQVFRY